MRTFTPTDITMPDSDRTQREIQLWRQRTPLWLGASVLGIVIALLMLQHQQWLPWLSGTLAGAFMVLRIWAALHEKPVVNTVARLGIVISTLSIGVAVQRAVELTPQQPASQGIAVFILAFALAGLTATLLLRLLGARLTLP